YGIDIFEYQIVGGRLNSWLGSWKSAAKWCDSWTFRGTTDSSSEHGCSIGQRIFSGPSSKSHLSLFVLIRCVFFEGWSGLWGARDNPTAIFHWGNRDVVRKRKKGICWFPDLVLWQ